MKKNALTLIALVAGLGCAVILTWLWRATETEPSHLPRGAHVAPAAASPAAATPRAERAPASLDPRALSLVEALQNLLGRANARAREALLAFKDDAAYRRFLERARQAGLTVVGQLDGLRVVRVRFDDPRAMRNELIENAGDYDSIAGNQIVGIPRTPAKEDRAATDHVPFGNDALAFLGAAGDRSDWGRGTTIAIIDSGVASDATFGAGRLRAIDIGLGTGPGKGGDDGHGTAVAALAAGLSADAPGVAPAANLLSIRVTDASGLSDIFTVAQAIVAAVDAGAKIVNVSLGGYSTSAALSAAIGYATDRGALVVAAAGNDQAAQLAWPAADARVVSVGAVDKAEQQVSFSNSGPQLTLSAPGYGVQTAWLEGQRAYVDGTSASAPLVSGAIAAVISRNPALTPQQAAQLLTRNSSDAGAPGNDPAYGHGILNLGWAMNSSNPGYIDTAVSSHYFDAAANEMNFVVQNRSSQPVTGLRLDATASGTPLTWSVPTLAPGQTFVVKTSPNEAAFKAEGKIEYTTQLVNPVGLTDKVPANNRKGSVLTAPTP